MRVVVSDTSPLRALHHLHLVSILPVLYGEVIIPPAVAEELEQPRASFAPVDLHQYPFVKRRTPLSAPPFLLQNYPLHDAEIEALTLAVELQADTILIDEFAGREVAAELGLTMTGAVGILARAKAIGAIPSLRPLLDDLRANLRFFISDRLFKTILRNSGEL